MANKKQVIISYKKQIECQLTMRSMTQLGPDASGAIRTQLSSAVASTGVAPPQTRISTGVLYAIKKLISTTMLRGMRVSYERFGAASLQHPPLDMSVRPGSC
jgi:hypothetical protein